MLCCSSAVTVDQEFAFWKRGLGAANMAEARIEHVAGSPIALKVAAPAQGEGALQPEQLGEVLSGLDLSGGGLTICLFTSIMRLKRLHAAIYEPLMRSGVNVYSQGINGSRGKLLRQIREGGRGVLLATDKGFEAEALRGLPVRYLLIDQLPFDPPSDPVVAARAGRCADRFEDYLLPRAVLRFRQQVRLLKAGAAPHRELYVLDGRIASKSYGEAFVAAVSDWVSA
jgi:ATP-dependent DNA helicase DinG